MEFLNDRIGILLKYGKVLGSLTKRFFYIDNSGNLYYTNEESVSKKFLETKNFNDEYFISLIAPIGKKINLSECSVSAVKQYLDDKFNLKGRSYFELFLKTREYRTILIFPWGEEHIDFLRDYFLSISNFNEMNSLNDQFGKYDSTDNVVKSGFDRDFGSSNHSHFEDASRNNNSFENSEFNMTKNKEKRTQKIFEFAEVSVNVEESTNDFNSIPTENSKNLIGNNFGKNNLHNNLSSIKEKSAIDNLNNNNINKNFSFKNAIPDIATQEPRKVISETHKQDAFEINFLNKQKKSILNQDSKTGLDNLNSKLNSDLNHKEEDLKYMEDYNSYYSVNNSNNNNFNHAEALKNKIYQITFEEKKRVEELLDKLNGRFVNQIDWEKACIRLTNPSGSEYEYEETWAQMENGSDYSGHVINFMPNGQGKEYRKDGIFYTGEFKNGKWHGLGVITDVNLDTFQGEFVNGCICGI